MIDTDNEANDTSHYDRRPSKKLLDEPFYQQDPLFGLHRLPQHRENTTSSGGLRRMTDGDSGILTYIVRNHDIFHGKRPLGHHTCAILVAIDDEAIY